MERHLHPISLSFIIFLHICIPISLYLIYFYGLSVSQIIYYISAYLLGGFGITLLYHRVWTHGAAKLNKYVEFFFAITSIFMLQQNGKIWIAEHIKHHQHTDNKEDPYSTAHGFWWAHQNWVVYSYPYELPRLPKRLENNKILEFQSKYYWLLSILLNIAIPAILAISANAPWWSGVIISLARVMVCNHFIYGINSICHYFGTQPFSKANSSRNVWWWIFTLGEQYHNYHHTFPKDYRNGIYWYDFDPTKWLLKLLTLIGLAKDLHKTPQEKITRAVAEQR
ncbi:MAG: fatty acid desaturase [Alphaproteobacteria bacterium]|nr:fatty acid desaturase [Alphaproteobacteria bacterium]MDD9920630.1 fatty acid desaturase [Alphaproteobacteria bacterium]